MDFSLALMTSITGSVLDFGVKAKRLVFGIVEEGRQQKMYVLVHFGLT
jgi:hypothetical protein